MCVFLDPCSNVQQRLWRDSDGFRILLVPMMCWRLRRGVGVRRDQMHGISGHKYLTVMAWRGGVDLWDGCGFFCMG